MKAQDSDKDFVGSVPNIYQRYLVPLIFEPYASDIAARVAARLQSGQLLEIAAGTGVVTRRLASALPSSVSITATDLNQPMIDQAIAAGTSRPVEWRQADAMRLPFPDRSFDVVVCQFGAMFFPDKAKAFAEARRILRPGGCFVFNVWDRLDQNEFPDIITRALAEAFRDDPPRFLPRTPYGYELSRVLDDLAQGGFARQTPATVSARARAESAKAPAIGFCQGTPLRVEIEARGPLEEATGVAAAAIANRFGSGPVDGKIQAHVVVAE